MQPQLQLRDPRYRRPTMTLSAACGVLDCLPAVALSLLDVGVLVAVNIALPSAAARELRFLTDSVAECQRDNPGLDEHCVSTIVPDDAINRLLPPHQKPFVTGREIQRACACSPTHVLNLIRYGCLTLLPDTTITRGPAGFACVTRTSYVTFLTHRLL